MKRYRITCFNFDTNVYSLTDEIRDEWEESVKASHREAREQTIAWITRKYGEWCIDEKVQNFIDIGPNPFSILSNHNIFFDDIRNAFVIGAYYPALTATCALGERVLNHLVLILRSDFPGRSADDSLYTDGSFSNWKKAIDALVEWNVLLPDAAEAFRKLSYLRHKKSIHFNPEVDIKDREFALDAIRLMNKIIESQFSFTDGQPWIKWIVPGEIYVDKTAETQPFVKKFILPNCVHVGPFHVIESLEGGRWTIRDDSPYEDNEITDEDYAKLRTGSRDARFAMMRDPSLRAQDPGAGELDGKRGRNGDLLFRAL